MEYKELVRDFANRTRSNLDAIDHLVSNGATAPSIAEVFPFTQLCNSLLGLVVLPKERAFQSLPETALDDLDQLKGVLGRMKWEVKHTRGAQKGKIKDQTLREFVAVLRHSIAHFNIEFTTANGTICGVRMWNYPNPSAKQVDFEIELSAVELRKVALLFLEHLQ